MLHSHCRGRGFDSLRVHHFHVLTQSVDFLYIHITTAAILISSATPISRITESSIQNRNTKKTEIPMGLTTTATTRLRNLLLICLLFDNTFNVIIITVKNFIWCTNYQVLRKRKHNESIHIYFRGKF